jgi:hypothetical protein
VSARASDIDIPTLLICVALVLAAVAVALGTFSGVSLLAIIAATVGGVWRWVSWLRGR